MADAIIPPPDIAGYWHFTYITTDPLDGRWYGGKRSTRKHPLSDRYLGSGNWIRAHQARERLKREIVAFYATSSEVYAAEIELVTWVDVDDPLCMNLWSGGKGMTVEGARRRSANPEWQAAHGARLRRLHTDPKWQEASAAGQRRKSANPKWQEDHALKLRHLNTDKPTLKKRAEGIARRWADPVERAAHEAQIRRVVATPEWQNATTEANRRKAKDPEFRKAHIAGVRKLAANPTWQANVKAAARRRAEDPVWLERMQTILVERNASTKQRTSVSEANRLRAITKRDVK